MSQQENVQTLDKKNLTSIHRLILVQFVLIYMVLFQHYIQSDYSLMGLITRMVVGYFYIKLMVQTMYQLYYSFWTFYFFFLLYCVINFLVAVTSTEFQIGSVLIAEYLLIFCFAILTMIYLSSPIYYPLIKWWEYDFRFEQSWKVNVKMDTVPSGTPSHFKVPESFPGRISDFRREAICLVLFEELPLGSILSLTKDHDGKTLEMHAKVYTKRYGLIGRGVHYEAKVIGKNKTEKKNRKKLTKLWVQHGKQKKKLKFQIRNTA